MIELFVLEIRQFRMNILKLNKIYAWSVILIFNLIQRKINLDKKHIYKNLKVITFYFGK